MCYSQEPLYQKQFKFTLKLYVSSVAEWSKSCDISHLVGLNSARAGKCDSYTVYIRKVGGLFPGALHHGSSFHQ